MIVFLCFHKNCILSNTAIIANNAHQYPFFCGFPLFTGKICDTFLFCFSKFARNFHLWIIAFFCCLPREIIQCIRITLHTSQVHKNFCMIYLLLLLYNMIRKELVRKGTFFLNSSNTAFNLHAEESQHIRNTGKDFVPRYKLLQRYALIE